MFTRSFNIGLCPLASCTPISLRLLLLPHRSLFSFRLSPLLARCAAKAMRVVALISRSYRDIAQFSYLSMPVNSYYPLLSSALPASMADESDDDPLHASRWMRLSQLSIGPTQFLVDLRNASKRSDMGQSIVLGSCGRGRNVIRWARVGNLPSGVSAKG